MASLTLPHPGCSGTPIASCRLHVNHSPREHPGSNDVGVFLLLRIASILRPAPFLRFSLTVFGLPSPTSSFLQGRPDPQLFPRPGHGASRSSVQHSRSTAWGHNLTLRCFGTESKLALSLFRPRLKTTLHDRLTLPHPWGQYFSDTAPYTYFCTEYRIDSF